MLRFQSILIQQYFVDSTLSRDKLTFERPFEGIRMGDVVQFPQRYRVRWPRDIFPPGRHPTDPPRVSDRDAASPKADNGILSGAGDSLPKLDFEGVSQLVGDVVPYAAVDPLHR